MHSLFVLAHLQQRAIGANPAKSRPPSPGPLHPSPATPSNTSAPTSITTTSPHDNTTTELPPQPSSTATATTSAPGTYTDTSFATARTPETAPAPEPERSTFNWTSQWYPMAVTADLDPQRPTQLHLLGIAMAVWRDKEGAWHAVEDRCSHRCVWCLFKCKDAVSPLQDQSFIISFSASFLARGGGPLLPQVRVRPHVVAGHTVGCCVFRTPPTWSYPALGKLTYGMLHSNCSADQCFTINHYLCHVVLIDSCRTTITSVRSRFQPTRLAPLSEGRIETDGSLACAYHGW